MSPELQDLENRITAAMIKHGMSLADIQAMRIRRARRKASIRINIKGIDNLSAAFRAMGMATEQAAKNLEANLLKLRERRPVNIAA